MAQLTASSAVPGSIYVNQLKLFVLSRAVFSLFCLLVLLIERSRQVLRNRNDVELTGLDKGDKKEEMSGLSPAQLKCTRAIRSKVQILKGKPELSLGFFVFEKFSWRSQVVIWAQDCGAKREARSRDRLCRSTF